MINSICFIVQNIFKTKYRFYVLLSVQLKIKVYSTNKTQIGLFYSVAKGKSSNI